MEISQIKICAFNEPFSPSLMTFRLDCIFLYNKISKNENKILHARIPLDPTFGRQTNVFFPKCTNLQDAGELNTFYGESSHENLLMRLQIEM